MKLVAAIIAATLIAACVGGEHPAVTCHRNGGTWINVPPIYINNDDVSIPIDRSFCEQDTTPQ